MKTVVIIVLAAGVLSGCAGAQAEPAAAPASSHPAVTITNCGARVTVAAPPKRAVAMEQNATEILLSLGLAGRMAGTSYQTDPVLPQLRAAYDSVPVLAKLYPSREKVLEAQPDFVYSTFTSAYAGDAAGPRKDLARLNVPAYLSRFACEDPAAGEETVTFDGILAEIREVATLFGVPGEGERLAADQQSRLAAAVQRAQGHSGKSVLFHYSGTTTPYVAGPGGVPAAISDKLGLRNAYGDAQQRWPAGSWERIAARNPDVIVLADLTAAATATAPSRRSTSCGRTRSRRSSTPCAPGGSSPCPAPRSTPASAASPPSSRSAPGSRG